jgi:hypothetical protein
MVITHSLDKYSTEIPVLNINEMNQFIFKNAEITKTIIMIPVNIEEKDFYSLKEIYEKLKESNDFDINITIKGLKETI